MNILKRVRTILMDLLLLAAVCLVMGYGVYGMPLPYRSIFADVGPYQLQAFPTGLALFHPQRPQTPFYNFSPVNDYVVEKGERVPLLSHESYVSGDYQHAERVLGVDGIVATVRQYLGIEMPWYNMSIEGKKVSYVTSRLGETISVTRTIIYTEPKEIESQVMTLWYNEGEIVTQDKTTGVVTIQNPGYPGRIEVLASQGDSIKVDPLQRVVEVTKDVNARLSRLTMTIEIRGME